MSLISIEISGGITTVLRSVSYTTPAQALNLWKYDQWPDILGQMSNWSVRVFQKKKKKKVQQSDGTIMQTFIHIKSLVIKTFYLPWWILVKEALNML